MDKLTAPGRLVFAIDVASRSTQCLSDIRAIFVKHAMPATWAVDDMNSPWIADLVPDPLGHEISLLAAGPWCSEQATRQAFYQGLHSHLQQAAVAGVAISSIAMTHCHLPGHLDLLGKHQIAAVRTLQPARRGWSLATTATQPTPHRYGVMQMPAVDVEQDGLRGARVAIRKAAARGETAVIRIGTAAIASGAIPISTVERLAQAATQLVRQGRLQLQTLTATANSLARRRQMSPAQSILRAA